MQTCNDCTWFRKGDGVFGLEYYCVKPDNIFEDDLNCGVPIPLDPFTAFSDVKGKCLMFREKKEEQIKNIDRIKTLDVDQLATVLAFIKGSSYIGIDKFVYFGGFSAPTKDSPFETDRKDYTAMLESEDDSIIDAILDTIRCE